MSSSPQLFGADETTWAPLPSASQRRIRSLPEPDAPAPAAEASGDHPPLVLLLSIEEAGQALGVRRTKIYQLIGRGDLEVVHIDRSARVPVESVRAYVERLRARHAH